MTALSTTSNAAEEPSPNDYGLADYKSYFRDNFLSESPPSARQPPSYNLDEPDLEEPMKPQSEPLPAEEEVRSTIPSKYVYVVSSTALCLFVLLSYRQLHQHCVDFVLLVFLMTNRDIVALTPLFIF